MMQQHQQEQLSSSCKSDELSRKQISSSNYSNEFDIISFLGSTLHDFKTNLNIINFTLQNNLQESSQQETYQIVKSQTMIIEIYLNIFQDISRLSTKKNQITLHSEKFSLFNLLNQIKDHFTVILMNKKTKFYLKNEIGNLSDYTLQSDEFRLKSLLIILLENAVKFTDSGKIILTVFQGFNQSIRFQILDTGVGIPESKYPLFETPIDQLTVMNQTVNQLGMGIGLYYSKKLLKSLGPTDRIKILNMNQANSFIIEDGIGSIIEFTIFSDISRLKNRTQSQNCLFNENISQSFKVAVLKESKKKLSTLIQQSYETESQESVASDTKQKMYSSSIMSYVQKEQQEAYSDLDELPECDYLTDFLSNQPLQNFPKVKLFNNQCARQLSFLQVSSPVQNKKTIQSPTIISQFKKQGVYPFNVLIVDDVQFNVEIVKTYIKQSKQLKFNTLEAYNGQQALQLYKTHNDKPNIKNIDIIIMDCDMPIMNGYDACFAIKQLVQYKYYLNVKIIAFSCFQGEEQQILCQKAKFDGILQKPCQLNNFLQYIEKLILIL